MPNITKTGLSKLVKLLHLGITEKHHIMTLGYNGQSRVTFFVFGTLLESGIKVAEMPLKPIQLTRE